MGCDTVSRFEFLARALSRYLCQMSAVRVPGNLVLNPELKFNSVKVFSATMFEQRDRLGETVSNWIAANANIKLTDITVTQSSDAAFHCIAITVFYWQPVRTK